MGNPLAVHLSYVASTKAIREILETISTPNDRWWIEGATDKDITIAYDPEAAAKLPGINILTFRFPVVYHLLFPGGDGDMILLDPNARREELQGLYVEESQLVTDDKADWEKFWPALKNELEKMRQNLVAKYSLDGVT